VSNSTKYYDLNEKDDWQTPPDLIDDISEAVGGIDVDPCAHENTSYGETNYRLEDGDDGLEEDWNDVAFVNPPFSYKSDWLEKAIDEVESGNADTVIFITPDGTDTKSWWHKFIATHSEYICFHYGRLSYYDDGEEMDSPTFGTAISVFGECPEELLDLLQEYGHVVKTID
jgi:phage N-6-adenine-methyltransferase